MHAGNRFWAADSQARAILRRNVAVLSAGPFKDYVRTSKAVSKDEAFVLKNAGIVQNPLDDLHTGISKTLDSATGDERKWISTTYNNPRDACRQNQIDARRRLSKVRTRFKGNVQRRSR
jgi:hypothetical protein